MSDDAESGSKTHYICQTYIAAKGAPGGLKVDKLFQYSTAGEAERRAEREAASDSCVGADAYMVVEDSNSGEVGLPTFLGRHGTVPDNDDY